MAPVSAPLWSTLFSDLVRLIPLVEYDPAERLMSNDCDLDHSDTWLGAVESLGWQGNTAIAYTFVVILFTKHYSRKDIFGPGIPFMWTYVALFGMAALQHYYGIKRGDIWILVMISLSYHYRLVRLELPGVLVKGSMKTFYANVAWQLTMLCFNPSLSISTVDSITWLAESRRLIDMKVTLLSAASIAVTVAMSLAMTAGGLECQWPLHHGVADLLQMPLAMVGVSALDNMCAEAAVRAAKRAAEERTRKVGLADEERRAPSVTREFAKKGA